MKPFFYTLLLVFLFTSCKEDKQDTSKDTSTVESELSSFIPKDFSLLFSTTPNSYFPLLFQMKKNGNHTQTNLADIKALLTFLKLDEKIYAFNRGKQLSGVSFNIHDSTTYRTFLTEKFVCEFSQDQHLEFAQTQFNEFTFYSVWNNSRAVIFQSFNDLTIDEIKTIVQSKNCIPESELNTYDSEELIAYHLQLADSILKREQMSIDGTIDIQDSSIIITSALSEQNQPFSVFQLPKDIKLPKGLFSGYLNLTPKAKNIVLEQVSTLPKIETILKNWTGELSWVYSGTDTIKSQIISYEYDDDFNEVEVKKTSKKAFYQINGAVTMNSAETANKILNHMDEMGILIKDKKEYTSILFTDMTKISSSQNQIIVQSSTKSPDLIHHKTSFLLTIDNSKNNLIEHLKLPHIHLKRFKPLAQHINSLRVTSPSSHSIVLKLKFDQEVVPALQTLVSKSSRF